MESKLFEKIYKESHPELEPLKEYKNEMEDFLNSVKLEESVEDDYDVNDYEPD
jgi:hypothetical protein